ncbi:DNA ligase 1 isoform X2 [Benincasa hispida]|uniref:DNA ligase 1 isoform X2 n=1 Tax=Benincasa hispida TaxID=102211 RepID=UPI0019008056|nr:DNA ligase 1 isoform X2 [Benincasa hispida]
MLSLRSCYYLRPITLPHPQFKKLIFFNKPPSFKPIFQNFVSSMSSRPSAFDALMSGARAAAKKKPVNSSPKKRKALDSLDPPPKPSSSVALESTPAVESQCGSSIANLDNHGGTHLVKSEDAADLGETKLRQDNGGSVEPKNGPFGNKACASSVQERTAKLKSSIPELKRKAKDFNSKNVACWKEGERVPFLFLCLGFDMISEESSRIIITDIVCNMLRTVMDTTPDDLVSTVYLLANKIAPAHEGLELGIGDASIIKALSEAFGRTEAQVKKQYKELGDLGLVAKASRSSQSMMRKPDALTITKVFDTFRLIAKESGKDSQEKKKNHIKSLLVAATDCEPLYLIRLLQASKIVKQVYSILPVYDKLVPALLSGGVWNLSKTCNFTPGIPIGPMLAKPTKGVSEILNKFQGLEFTCEYKYDGERAQIHYMEDGSVEIYSRNAERNTGKFPDVVLTVSRIKKPSVRSFILDCELVAYDHGKQKILPFQILSTRARKNVAMSDIKVEVCVFAFDLLYLDGQPLIQRELNVRRELLYDSFIEEPGYFQFATAIITNDLEEIQKFLDASVDQSCEGLIIKTLNRDATYEPSKRSHNWLKLKKDYIDSIGDSLDLVPIAAFHGRGKRTGVYGAFLLACYDNDNEEFQSICKIGTGFSEAMLEERSASLRSKVIPEPKSYYRYGDTINPDVWFEPTEVWEVKAADLTISPVHRAGVGIVDSDKGISLRFPRLVRVRKDKNPEEASSSEQVADMYNAQKHNHQNNQDDNEDD